MDLTEEITGLNDEINRLFTGFSVDLDALFEMLLSGNVSGALQMCFQNLAQAFQGEIKSFKSMIVMLLCVGILAALLMNLTDLFENKQIADIGFYFVYLFLILLLLRIFGVVTDTAQVLISDMLVFMKLFMPVYFLAVGAAGGVTTGLLYYQFILTVIYVMEAALSAFLMPLIKVYIFLAFMNGLWTEEKLQMMLDLLKRVIGYILKIFFAVITGISMIQSMITPVIESVKMSAMQKTISLIPGIGNVSDSVAELVIGSAVLIKNSAGVLAVLLLTLLCALPALKIWILAMLLKFSAALTGIVSDKRITSCMDRVGEGSLLVLRIVLTAGGLFLIMIAIAAMTTNRGF